MSMATNLNRVVTYHERLPPLGSYEPLITRSCEIMWQTKIIITPLVEWLRQPNLTGWYLTLMGCYPESHKLKPLYLHYHSGYGLETWLDGDLLWTASNHKVIQHTDYVLLQIHVTNENHFISTNRVLIPITFWLRGLTKSRDKLKLLYLHWHDVYDRQTW